MLTCCIQWVDAAGKPTPDQNPAIGHVWVMAHEEWIANRPTPYEVPESTHFPICATHAAQLRNRGMGWWTFAVLDAPSLA